LTVNDLPEKLRQFLFEHIDSVEQLDMIVLFFEQQNKWWTAKLISEELRTSLSSAGKRLLALHALGLIVPNESNAYQYQPKSPELAALIENLVEQYKLRRHTILQLIFSSMKRAKTFANAFVIAPNEPKEEED
jgi:hypothetical protein